MAVAYESVSIGTWEGNQSGETLVITKPTGLAVDDLMILHMSSVGDTGDPGTYGWTATGWTQVLSNADTSTSPKIVMDVWKKTADAGDVAASDFTFTHNENDVGWTNGAIYRISGAVTGNIQTASSLVRADTTPTYANTITQTYPDSLLLFLVTAVDNAASGSVASYAITTDNPTWTERYDSYADSAAFGGAGYGDGLMAGATAMRTATTATGDATVTLTNFDGSVGALIIIPPVVNITQTPTVLSATFSVEAPTITGDANTTPTELSATFTVQAPTVSFPTPTYTNLAKSATSTFTNPDKS